MSSARPTGSEIVVATASIWRMNMHTIEANATDRHSFTINSRSFGLHDLICAGTSQCIFQTNYDDKATTAESRSLNMILVT
jgi:hypothetical protein